MNWILSSSDYIDFDWKEFNQDWIKEYSLNYEILKSNHPLYKTGWSSSASSAHRFIPRLVWWKLSKFYRNKTILDFGTYDGTLVKALRDSKVEAYGYDYNRWDEMWDMLKIKQYINISIYPKIYDIVIALNICHNWIPSDFIWHIKDFCGGYYPRIIIADRDQANPHPNNSIWNSEDVIKAGFTSYTFSQAEPSRDLLIWGTI